MLSEHKKDTLGFVLHLWLNEHNRFYSCGGKAQQSLDKLYYFGIPSSKQLQKIGQKD
jgi:hypothetical protein